MFSLVCEQRGHFDADVNLITHDITLINGAGALILWHDISWHWYVNRVKSLLEIDHKL